MESTAFDMLEQKINQIIACVDRLQKENQVLKDKNRSLIEKVSEHENALGILKSETEKYSGMRTEVDSYREKQSQIQSKVESLLDKLKEFDDLE